MTWLTQARGWCQDFEEQWLGPKSDKRFHELASEQFAQRDWVHGFELHEVLDEVFFQLEGLTQLNAGSRFGDLPITLFYSPKGEFVLDLYVWDEFHTSIHDHAFEGCFHVLQGSSLESLYSFEKVESKGDCHWGTLRPQELNLLPTGHTRPIVPDRGTIHRVLHLSRPTVSLALRTFQTSNVAGPQLTYRFGCLASPSHLAQDRLVKYRILDWALKQGRYPEQLIGEFINYGELWEKLLGHKSSIAFGFRLAIAQGRHNLPLMVDREGQLIQIMRKLKDELAMKLLCAYEFYGPILWTEWVEKNLRLSPEEAKMRLKSELEKVLPQIERELSKEKFLLPLFS